MSVEDELKEAGTEEQKKMRDMKREMINSLDLGQYVFPFFSAQSVQKALKEVA